MTKLVCDRCARPIEDALDGLCQIPLSDDRYVCWQVMDEEGEVDYHLCPECLQVVLAEAIQPKADA